MTPIFLDFLQILTPKGLQIYLYFRRVFKKVDFTKTSVSPRRERQIQGPQPSKNNQKSMKNNMKKTTSQQSKFSPIWTSKNLPKSTPNLRKSRIFVFAGDAKKTKKITSQPQRTRTRNASSKSTPKVIYLSINLISTSLSSYLSIYLLICYSSP